MIWCVREGGLLVHVKYHFTLQDKSHPQPGFISEKVKRGNEPRIRETLGGGVGKPF